MDSITFEIGDITIQLVNGDALFWRCGVSHEPDFEIPIEQLRRALSTAGMLLRNT